MRRARPEEDLHRATSDLFTAVLSEDIFWWHTPNQRGTRKKWENQLLKALGVKAGFPDFGLIYQGRAYFVELKPEKYRNHKDGGLSDAQIECHAKLKWCGCQVAVCYTPEEVEGTVRAWMPVKGGIAA